MRHDDVEEHADRAGTIEPGRLLLLLIQRLERRQQDQEREGRPFPGADDQDDRGQRQIAEPVDRLPGPAMRRSNAKTR